MVRVPTSAPATVTVSDGKINIKCSGIAIEKEDGDDNSLGTGSLSADVTTNM